MSNTNIKAKTKASMNVQLIGGAIAMVAAVVLPQILHLLGIMSGLGTKLGEVFLPMHLPIIAVGLLVGPYAGLIAGMLAPVISHLATGMPGSVLLPFMVIELAAYGMCAGGIKDVKAPIILKILTVQVTGRVVRAIAMLISVYAMGNTSINTAIILNSIKIGAFGLVLQWTLLPLFVFWVMKKKENNNGKDA